MRILVVDDETFVRDFVRDVLASHGYEVIAASDGIQGLQLAKCQPCDLVITDQIMPLMKGLDMISRLAAERYPARYLLISGYGANQRVPPGLSFLSKPFTPSQLMEAVERLREEPTLAELELSWRLAKNKWQESTRQTREILADVRSQIPNPDGALRMVRAELKQRTTYERYSQAFHKYREALKACGVLGATTETPEPEGDSE